MISYYSGFIHRKKHSENFTLLSGFAVSVFAMAIGFLFLRPKMDADLKKADIHLYLFAISFLLGAFAYVIWITKRIRIHIAQNENDGTLQIDVVDKELPNPLQITGPIFITKHWFLQDLGRNNKVKKLYLSIYNSQNVALVTFTGARGRLYDPPIGFESVDHIEQIPKAELVYNTGKIEDIAHAIWCYEDYLALKNKPDKSS